MTTKPKPSAKKVAVKPKEEATPKKRGPGRPWPHGPTPDKERTARSIENLVKAGGRRLSPINLSPEANQNLEFSKEALSIETNKDAVEMGLELLAKKAKNASKG